MRLRRQTVAPGKGLNGARPVSASAVAAVMTSPAATCIRPFADQGVQDARHREASVIVRKCASSVLSSRIGMFFGNELYAVNGVWARPMITPASVS